jgi:hypothetical protein
MKHIANIWHRIHYGANSCSAHADLPGRLTSAGKGVIRRRAKKALRTAIARMDREDIEDFKD